MVFVYIMFFKSTSSIRTIYIVLSIAYMIITNLITYRKIIKYISDDKLIKIGLYNGFAAAGFMFSGSKENDSCMKKLKIECRIIYLLEIIQYVLLMVVI